METTTLQAEVRATRGKGPARRLRAEGKIPGVFYGPGVPPTPLTLSPKEVTQALRGERGRNVVFKLSVDGKDHLAMAKDVTTDPVTHELLHIDLYRILEDKVLEVHVPLHATGRSVGVVQGGVLNITRRTLPLRTTPANIPVSIDVDVTHLDLKDTISVEDLEFPQGVECMLRPNLTLAIVLEPRKATAADEEEEAAAAAAAAPAAEGAAPAADADKADS
ncbi:MAG: 50S ribosomal protein L25/general stress protein Ctc [Deltaproteobacteria bacterium]|nr:50S ribosomal protein L25/general stress protein Ctc [Deltaproteobacteria bacterium]